ncbi:Zinc transporter 2 [Nymphon striatum]|nr:Zinc transporter 2 [Nymphon striatum]
MDTNQQEDDENISVLRNDNNSAEVYCCIRTTDGLCRPLAKRPGSPSTNFEHYIYQANRKSQQNLMGASLYFGGVSHGHSHGTPDPEANHAHSHGKKSNINVRAAFIHVLGDLVQSIGVLIAATIIYFKPDYKIVDPICTFVFSILVLITTYNIIKDALHVLMEGIPRGFDFNEVKSTLQEIPGVIEIHNLRIWSLTLDKVAMSVHLAIDKQYKPLVVLKQASTKLRSEYSLLELTIQIEEYKEIMKDCGACQQLKD